MRILLRVVVLLLSLPALATANDLASDLASDQAGEHASEHVIVIHGLGRSDRAMKPLARRLSEHGFAVHNVHYPSTEAHLETLTEWLGAEVRTCRAHASGPIHFVGHSLGGLLVRAHLADHPLPEIGRVVMLAPPNHGSEVVDRLGRLRLFRRFMGPTAAVLGTDGGSLPQQLPAPDYEIGIIAGRRSINPLGSWMIPGPDDGAVSVDSTRLEAATDYLVVDKTHRTIRRSPIVAQQVIRFLSSGQFDHSI